MGKSILDQSNVIWTIGRLDHVDGLWCSFHQYEYQYVVERGGNAKSIVQSNQDLILTGLDEHMHQVIGTRTSVLSNLIDKRTLSINQQETICKLQKVTGIEESMATYGKWMNKSKYHFQLYILIKSFSIILKTELGTLKIFIPVSWEDHFKHKTLPVPYWGSRTNVCYKTG